jgi:protein O-GlcNAc transferase
MRNQEAKTTLDHAIQLHQIGKLTEAEAVYRRVLQLSPNDIDALNMLGALAQQVGKHEIAVELIQPALSKFSEHLARPGAWFNLGMSLFRLGRLQEAVQAFEAAVRVKPDDYEAANNLGASLHALSRDVEAIAVLRQVIQAKPDFAEAHNNLRLALAQTGQSDEALHHAQLAVRLKPDFAEGLSNLGTVLAGRGDLDGAIDCYRRAIDLAPHDPVPHSNLIFSLYFHPNYSRKNIHEEELCFREQHANPLKQFIKPHDNARDPERRLKIGYVSPDFREHCQSLFTIPLLNHHDRNRYEIYCYSDVSSPDQISGRIQKLADRWRSITGISDQQAAELIRHDQVDILIDLTMHMAANRLLIFARKPAPVQLTWLAYPGSTGLDAIDYRLTDPYLDPPGKNDELYSEKSVRLPDAFWCYDPLAEEPPVNALPAEHNGFITFGCLNNLAKINGDVLKMWSDVLREVPNSKLVLLSEPGSHHQWIYDQMQQNGVKAERIEFVSPRPRAEYLRLYHQIDIVLDTFPYNGHTTTLDSIWMGVPVISRAGETAVSRGGLSIWSNLGSPEMVARDAMAFVAIARELAGDLPRLSQLRSTLRDRLLHSPLMDAPKFARNIEATYRGMWRHFSSPSHL